MTTTHYVADLHGSAATIIGAPSLSAAARWAWPSFAPSNRLLVWREGAERYTLFRFNDDGDVTSREVAGYTSRLGEIGVEWGDFGRRQPVVVGVERWVPRVTIP